MNAKKTIIAGGRNYQFSDEDRKVLDSFEISEVVCGGANGADECGRRWAIDRGIPVKMFPADWGKHGKAAGPIRNREMAEYGERLIAFWDGQSRGTKNMIETARGLGLEVFVEMRPSR
jgi:hypothetical protein